MEYRFDIGAWNSVFAVPADIVDKHLKLAGGAQLKVMLWMLRHAGENFGTGDISAALSMHEADVRDSIQYWIQCGIIAEKEGSITPAPYEPAEEAALPDKTENKTEAASQPPEEQPAEPAEENNAKPRRALSRPEKPDMKYVTERMKTDPAVAFLMRSADDIFGRITSNNEKETLLLIHEYDGLPVEVILMLLQYASGIDKANMRYIEKMALSWAEEEITTLEAAEQKIKRLTEGRTAAGHIQSVLGLDRHSPTEMELSFATLWIDKWQFSDDMIRAAYEACVNTKGKYIPKYTNSILERWYGAGIRDVEQVEREKKAKAAKKQSKSDKSYKPTYDIAEYESTSVLDEEWDDE